MGNLYRPAAILHAHDTNIRGRGGIEAYYGGLACLPDLEVELVTLNAGGDGNVLWASGTSTNTFTFNGESLEVELRFMFVWKANRKGVFRIVAHQSSGTGPTGTIPS